LTSSIPIVMNSFAFGTGVNTPFNNTNFIKTYYIIGSTDGTNWYPIQSGTTNSVFVTASYSSSYVNVNVTGTQTLSGNSSGTFTTTSYSYSTNLYTYFRMVGTSIVNTGGASYMELPQWYINFSVA